MLHFSHSVERRFVVRTSNIKLQWIWLAVGESLLDIPIRDQDASATQSVVHWKVAAANTQTIWPNFSKKETKMDHKKVIKSHRDQTTAVAWHHLSTMILCCRLKKSFAGFLDIFMVLWLYQCSWRSPEPFFGMSIWSLEVMSVHDNSSTECWKVIKQCSLIYQRSWHVRGSALVVAWELAKCYVDVEIFFWREIHQRKMCPLAKIGHIGIKWPGWIIILATI